MIKQNKAEYLSLVMHIITCTEAKVLESLTWNQISKDDVKRKEYGLNNAW